MVLKTAPGSIDIDHQVVQESHWWNMAFMQILYEMVQDSEQSLTTGEICSWCLDWQVYVKHFVFLYMHVNN